MPLGNQAKERRCLLMAKSYTATSKRRSNILYKLRKKGVVADTKARTIELPYGSDPDAIIQVRRLRREYRFNVQFYIS